MSFPPCKDIIKSPVKRDSGKLPSERETLSRQWFEECCEDFFVMKYGISRTLFSRQSLYQKIEIFESKTLGRMLVLDDFVMISERDEFIYHDMIAHVPLFVHPRPERVLIIGGGDGGTAREVLRHPEVKQCTLVEIDELVVDACKKFIPQTASSFSDARLNLCIADGAEYVKTTSDTFDVVIIDSSDPIGPAQPLFGEKFYRNVYDCLAEDGLVVSQAESPFYEKEMQQSLVRILRSVFPWVGLYNYNNLTYPGGIWSFSFASKRYHPLNDFDPERVKNSTLNFDYYNEAIHRASFCLPQFMKKQLADVSLDS